MACIARFCRRNGLIHSCTNIESINMNPPAVITRKYEDQCGCRTCCSYPNNVWAILPAQILTVIAFVSSTTSFANCRLVNVPNTPENRIDEFTIKTLYNFMIPTGVENNNSTIRSMGLFAWEDIQGSCSVENYDSSEQLKAYWEFLGSDFRRLRVMGGVAVALGLVVLVWVICLQSCVAHTRRYRSILGFLMIFMLPLLQSLEFRVLATEFCQEKHCTLHENALAGITGAVLYFLAGLLLCVGTRDFPGNPYRKRKPTVRSKLRTLFGRRSETTSEMDTNDNMNNNYSNQRHDGSPLSDIEMVNYNNGFADAVEIPVESEFIDRTLIDGDALPNATTTTHATTFDLAELIQSTTTTTAYAMSDNHSVVMTSPHDLKSN
jgi:hypothetical protein